jgi:hypothetical protein
MKPVSFSENRVSDATQLVLETLQCGTNATGETVYMAMGGRDFEHRYTLPTNRLARFIEQLLKVYNTSRASGALAELAKQEVVPPVRPVIETFLVNDMTVIFTEAGPVTIRIVSRDGSRDIVLQPAQWERMRSAHADSMEKFEDQDRKH